MKNKAQSRNIPVLLVTCKSGNVTLGRSFTKMGNYETPRRVIDLRLDGRRIMRRPKYRWLERVVENMRELRISRWWVVATATES
jgi:hypothetical protein